MVEQQTENLRVVGSIPTGGKKTSEIFRSLFFYMCMKSSVFSNGLFYSASDFYKEKFGCKVYKISLDAGCTCPNRDGTKGTGGCIFCSGTGSGEFAADRTLSIPLQVEQAKSRVRAKNSGGRFIAYFQNFTSTYGDENLLMKKYTEALYQPDIAGLSVATRPDCLSDSILSFFASLSEKTFVSIELGFQTANELSAAYIHRAYPDCVYNDAVRRIKSASPKIHIVTHVIFGLPGETERDMLDTVRYCIMAGTDGIKISLLHVLSGTALEADYAEGKFKTMEMQEYFAVLGKALQIIPPGIVIHRLTGDGAKKLLISPIWTASKKSVYNKMTSYLRENHIVQGEKTCEVSSAL